MSPIDREKRRTEIIGDIYLDVATRKLGAVDIGREIRERLARAGLAYTPDEFERVKAEIRANIRSAALNSAIEGYSMSEEAIEQLAADQIRAVLG